MTTRLAVILAVIAFALTANANTYSDGKITVSVPGESICGLFGKAGIPKSKENVEIFASANPEVAAHPKRWLFFGRTYNVPEQFRDKFASVFSVDAVSRNLPTTTKYNPSTSIQSTSKSVSKFGVNGVSATSNSAPVSKPASVKTVNSAVSNSTKRVASSHPTATSIHNPVPEKSHLTIIAPSTPKNGPVRIVKFEAEHLQVFNGQSTWLKWKVENADRVEIKGNNPIADYRGLQEGRTPVSPKESTDYTLVAFGPGGPSTARLRVSVGENSISTSPSLIYPAYSSKGFNSEPQQKEGCSGDCMAEKLLEQKKTLYPNAPAAKLDPGITSFQGSGEELYFKVNGENGFGTSVYSFLKFLGVKEDEMPDYSQVLKEANPALVYLEPQKVYRAPSGKSDKGRKLRQLILSVSSSQKLGKEEEKALSQFVEKSQKTAELAYVLPKPATNPQPKEITVEEYMENRKRKMLIALLSFSISLFLTFSILLAYLYLKDRKSRRKKGGKLAQCVNIEEAIERYNAKREKNETRNGTPQEALEELRRRGLHSVANMVEKKHH